MRSPTTNTNPGSSIDDNELILIQALTIYDEESLLTVILQQILTQALSTIYDGNERIQAKSNQRLMIIQALVLTTMN